MVVTSYLGRNPAAVTELVRFCNQLGVGVLESAPNTVNYPHSDALYQGNHWNHPFQNRALAEADLVLVIDSDVPWIATVSKPKDDAAIIIIDVDPLKPSTPLWYIKAGKGLRLEGRIWRRSSSWQQSRLPNALACQATRTLQPQGARSPMIEAVAVTPRWPRREARVPC